MKVLDKISVLNKTLQKHRDRKESLGFVPTMGALHKGHMSLFEQASRENDVVIGSIFVNPIQFNNEEDLAKYPRTLSEDIRKLEQQGCDYVFTPSVEEIYPEPVNEKFDFGKLENVMEGKFRPGHFNGVAVVVRRLLEIVQPHKAYFGKKDYQQLQIVRKLVDMTNLDIEIVPVPISREPDGLALSSRNLRLKPEEREVAPAIYRIMREAKSNLQQFDTPKQMKDWGLKQLNQYDVLEPEYFEIVDMDTLEPIKQWSDTSRCILCVAVYAGKIRLIDNITLFF